MKGFAESFVHFKYSPFTTVIAVFGKLAFNLDDSGLVLYIYASPMKLRGGCFNLSRT